MLRLLHACTCCDHYEWCRQQCLLRFAAALLTLYRFVSFISEMVWMLSLGCSPAAAATNNQPHQLLVTLLTVFEHAQRKMYMHTSSLPKHQHNQNTTFSQAAVAKPSTPSATTLLLHLQHDLAEDDATCCPSRCIVYIIQFSSRAAVRLAGGGGGGGGEGGGGAGGRGGRGGLGNDLGGRADLATQYTDMQKNADLSVCKAADYITTD
jgi:uncharacterized membrane protein YgcG